MILDLPVHPKQRMALNTKATEILYGGAAGGGKSHLFRVVAIAWCLAIPGLQVYLFRREFPDLWANHMEGPGSFPELLGDLISKKRAKINESKGFIGFSNKSKIHLCHCQHEKDKYGYQGAEIHVLLMDELTHFTPSIYRYLRARCRVGGLKVPPTVKATFPRILCGSNPGGNGHNWVKAAFVDIAPPMAVTQMPPKEGGMLRQYIPAKLSDNPTVDAEDYSMKLQGLGNDALVKAMLDGDWDIVAGGMFDDVYRVGVHVLEPFPIPSSWRIDRTFDWGSSHPFSVAWWAESDGTEATLADGTKRSFPRGSLFRIAEWYGWNGNPDEGCKMLAVEIAKGIVKMQADFLWGSRVQPGPADNSIYDAENGVCIADDMARLGVRWTRSDKSPGSRKTGWEAMRRMFKACLTSPMEEAGLFVFSTCRHFIRTVPVLPRDPNKPEDVDTKAEDHCLVGETRVDTASGQFKISELVGQTGHVISHDGLWHQFQECRMTRKHAQVVRVTLSNGVVITCTPDHRFMSENGEWIEAQSLACVGSRHILMIGGIECQPKSVARSKNMTESGITDAEGISSATGPDSTALCGSNTMEKSQPGLMSTTLTVIGRTMGLRTFNSCMNQTTQDTTTLNPSGLSTAEWPSKRRKWPQLNGIRAQMATNGTKSNTQGLRMRFIKRLLESVNTAGMNTWGQGLGNSAQTIANATPGVILESTTSCGNALSVGNYSRSINMQRASIVAAPALGRLQVVSVEPVGMADVYCLRVPDTRSFTIEGGIITHNCGDETRYRVLAVKRIATVQPFRL